MTDSVETIIIGAGVIGLAIARQASLQGQDVLVVERHPHFGEETSSRNSEVIHAGIYYPAGSLKAQLCVKGREQLYQYCAAHHVPHKRLGKLIVATNNDELGILQTINEKAAANGVDDLQFISAARAMEMEPALSCVGALLSPSTGIIDTHQYMLSLTGQIEDRGGAIAYQTTFQSAVITSEGFDVQCGDIVIRCKNLINAGGLNAQFNASRISGLDQKHIPKRYLTKGNYFTMNKPSPFQRLIYPVPNTASLGVHVTLDLAGQIRFGPDQEWVSDLNYNVDPTRADTFYEAIRNYYPNLEDGSLIPAYAGIRPKIQGPNDPMRDFDIKGPQTHQIPGLVTMTGMESPGLTSSLAIAEHVMALLK